MIRRSRGRAVARRATTDAGVGTAGPTPPGRPAASPLVLAGVLACFLLSGFAALLYQTAWLRQFSLVFGTSELAVAAVLAAYMGGLALGAALAARFVSAVERPVYVYGLLEGGIAASALAVPVLLAGAGWLYVELLGHSDALRDARTLGQPLYYLLVAFAVLVVPTALMGATLPLLTRYAVRSGADIGPKVAVLYATNTGGAVAGTLVAAFVLLPAFGLKGTVWVGVGINALIFAAAVLLARAASGTIAAADDVTDGGRAPGVFAAFLERLRALRRGRGARVGAGARRRPVWILPLMAISGANAFFYEVLWTRLLAHVLGGSVYAFATMLAAFLTGIALGGGCGGAFARDHRQAARAFVVAQVAIAALSVAVYAWMQALIPETRSTASFAVYAVLVMLPATVFIGATFPLAVRILALDERDAGRSTARVYGWNTVGAIGGAVLAAFWLIPALGFAGSVKLAVLINLGIALAAASCAPSGSRRPAIVAAGALLASAAFVYSPQRPLSIVARTAFAVPESGGGRELRFAVGRSATVWLEEADGWFDLRTNGLPEASILPRGAAPVGQTQQWLAALPLVARPDAERMLLVGLGGGVALEGAPSSLRAIDVVELEREVVEANRVIGARRLRDPLQDPRVDIVINDARNALSLSSARYDIVVSQPSHPWTAGASHLFSREFFALAKEHLNEGGVFLQWMNSGFVDEALFRSLAATLTDVFANVRLYQPAPQVLLFLSSDGPLRLEHSLARTGRPVRDDPLYFGYMRLSGVDDLVAALLLDENGVRTVAEGAALTTDDRNRMAMGSRSQSDGLGGAEVVALASAYDPLADPRGWVHRELAADIDFGYVASRLLADGQLDRAMRLGGAVADPSTAAMIAGLARSRAGELGAARAEFLAALELDAGNDAARFALVQPALGALAAGRASAEMQVLARGLSGSAAAVVTGWRLAAQQDWQALSALDGQLAAADATDLWFPEAARLRADWRTRAARETGAAFDALRLIDRALAIRPELDLFVLRAAAADALGNSDAFVESARYAVRHVADRLDTIESGRSSASRAELDTAFRRIRALRGRLVQLPDGGERAAMLADRMGDALLRIQVLLRP